MHFSTDSPQVIDTSSLVYRKSLKGAAARPGVSIVRPPEEEAATTNGYQGENDRIEALESSPLRESGKAVSPRSILVEVRASRHLQEL